MQIFRHGDLPIVPINEVSGEKKKHQGSYVLALGEATGHRHVITAEPLMMFVYDIGGGMHILDLLASAKITHEEHGTLIIPPGKYRVGREREFDWFAKATRQVVD